MKTQKRKSLKFVKASIASLETKAVREVQGGRNNSLPRTLCITSCVAH
ncbi:hypothetical protein C8N46_101587 [Kordia periserrulae]|uniref:Uncharacterized protein n=1 Tax=Kordia periserrulae TaxID=701523 RepID=A0A2T6C6Q4_9FLAO|nr:hypothetical protein C8N46_101587 [Kordia periserrulae]